MAHTVHTWDPRTALCKTEMEPQTPVLENIRPIQPYLFIARKDNVHSCSAPLTACLTHPWSLKTRTRGLEASSGLWHQSDPSVAERPGWVTTFIVPSSPSESEPRSSLSSWLLCQQNEIQCLALQMFVTTAHHYGDSWKKNTCQLSYYIALLLLFSNKPVMRVERG